MAQSSTKFSIVPAPTGKSSTILDLDSSLAADSDPTRDIRSLIEQLQETASGARVLQKKAEDERDALAGKVGKLQLEVDSAHELARNAQEIADTRDKLLQQRVADAGTISELKNKFDACERLRAEAVKQRDELTRQKNELGQQNAALQKQSEEAVRQRDAIKRSEADGKAKVDEQKKRSAEVERDLADARKRLSATERELAEARKQNASTTKSGGDNQKQIAALKQARDAATAFVSELKSKVSSLEDQVADLSYERDSFAEKASASAKHSPLDAKEMDKAQKESADAAARACETEQRMNEKIEALEAAIAAVSAERDDLAKQNGLLQDTALQSAQASEPRSGKAESSSSMAEKFESQRMVTIELSAMLEKAQREIKEMGASLAEARLMLKGANRRGASAPRTQAQPVEQKAEVKAEIPRESSGKSSRIRAMRKSLAAFDRMSGSESLNELFTNAQALADQAGADEARVFHRVSTSLASMLHEFYMMPEQMTPSAVETLDEAIGFLASIEKRENLDQVANLDTARVYIVDDDQGVCETVASAIRAVGLAVQTTQMPGEALGELAGNSYDLLVLDVQLPELDGFELCSHIRTMDLHADTPIIFLSGDGSMENRVESSMRGGNDFISKPFNFHEMGLKILMRILRVRLSMS